MGLQRKSWPANGTGGPMNGTMYGRDQKQAVIETNNKFGHSDGEGADS